LKQEHKKTLVFVVCGVADLALLIATIGAALALLTGTLDGLNGRGFR
jgi:hypothetical protein